MHMLPGGAVKTESYAQRIKLGSWDSLNRSGHLVSRLKGRVRGLGLGFRVSGLGLGFRRVAPSRVRITKKFAYSHVPLNPKP